MNGSGASAVPELRTGAWVLADLDSGAILALHNPDEQRRPASALKLLTALTIAPRLHPDQQYRAVAQDETVEGNRVVLHAGLTYTVADLLHAALLPSANDAAEALARANGGIDVTLEQMNAEADRLGATSTTARNASGLDADGQFSTARDMAVIGRAALRDPEISRYLALRSVTFPGERKGGQRIKYPIYNQNRTLADGFRGTLGGKSGYTSGALRTYVGGAQRDGRRLLVSMLGIRGNTYTAAERLLNWGFANASQLTPLGQLAAPTAPAPQFPRTATPLPPEPSPTPVEGNGADDAPTATVGASSGHLPQLPLPDLPPPLTLLTLATAGLVVLRTRVYWITHRSRSAWVSLAEWSRRHRRSRWARHATSADLSGLPTSSGGQRSPDGSRGPGTQPIGIWGPDADPGAAPGDGAQHRDPRLVGARR